MFDFLVRLYGIRFETPADGGGSVAPSPTMVAPASEGDEPDLQEQLAESQRQTARERALRRFPTLSEELLNDLQGDPDQIEAYAERMHNQIAAQVAANQPAPAPAAGDSTAPTSDGEAVPTPVPGVGAAPTPGSIDESRMEELLDGVINKSATRRGATGVAPGRSDADELFALSIQKGFIELAGQRR